MSDDILNRIDSALANVAACFCGCQQVIKASSVSPWFASEDCQVRWNVRRITTTSSTEEEAPTPYRCRGCRLWMHRDVKLCGPCSALPSCGAERQNERTGRRMVCFRPAGHEPVTHEDSVTGSQWMDSPPSGGPPGSWFDETHVFRRAYLNERVEALRPFLRPALEAEADALMARVRDITVRAVADQPEPVSPHVGAALEPTYRRYECPHRGCDWVKVALDLDAFDGLLAEHERAVHAVEPDPDFERRPFKFTDLYRALRARARRGGTK